MQNLVANPKKTWQEPEMVNISLLGGLTTTHFEASGGAPFAS
jgi:hypothetical protein